MEPKDWPRSQAEWNQHNKEYNHHKLKEWWEANKERLENADAT